MKDQASLNLLIVDSPIDSKALTGHLMLRATSSGLKVYDVNGSEQELGGGGGIDWSNVSASTINLSTTTGELKLMGASSMTLELPASNSKIHFEGASLNLFATDLNFNGSALNTAEGLVQLDESGRLPAVDGSQLTNLPAATVDLTNYSTSTIHLTSTDGDVKLTTGNGNGSIQLTVTDDGNPDRATFKTPGVWDIQMGSYLTKITGTQQMDIEADGSACPVKITAGSNGGDIELNASGSIKFNGAALNTANGLVQLGSNGKLPTSLYEAGGNTDLSSYTGFVDITGKNGDSTIHAADGNLVLSSDSNVVLGGIYVACQTDFITPSVSSESSDLLIRTSNSEHSIVLAPGSFFQGNPADAPSGSIKFYADNIVYNDHQQNTPGGVAIIADDGKLPVSIIPESSGGGSFVGATPQLMFTVPSNASGLHLEITAGKLADGTDNAALINTATSADHRAKVLGNSGGADWIACPDTGFGTNFAGWPVKVDVTGLLDPSEISYIRYRWVPTSGDPSDWYAMVYPCATEAPIPSSGGSGGDTTELDNRVTALESTVGSLDAAVDEILADYGEGSGALVYRVVASATEPENPTEGMIWIQTA